MAPRAKTNSLKETLTQSRPWRRARAVLGWLPLTWRSAVGLGLLVWLRQAYGVERSDLVLLVLGTGGIALIVVALVAVTVAALLVRWKARAEPGQPWVFQTDAPLRTGHRLGWLAWLPLVRLELGWDSPQKVEVELVPHRARLHEEVIAWRRTQIDHLERRWTISDTFGMARITFSQRIEQSIKILPSPGRLKPRELLQQMSSGDLVSHPGGEPQGDLIEMRRYAPGDPIKRVLWKIYARTGKLLVRLPERAIAPRQKTLAYLVAHLDDEPAAGTARAALEQGIFGQDFIFMADGEPQPTSDIPEAIEQIVRSSTAHHIGGTGLEELLAIGKAQGSSACVVFAPAVPGKWLTRVETQLKTHPRQISVVLAIDGIHALKQRSLLQRILVAEQDDRNTRIQNLRAVWDRLVAAGAPVTVIDRASGLAVHPQQLHARPGRTR